MEHFYLEWQYRIVEFSVIVKTSLTAQILWRSMDQTSNDDVSESNSAHQLKGTAHIFGGGLPLCIGFPFLATKGKPDIHSDAQSM